MKFKELHTRILKAWNKTENRDRILRKIIDEECGEFNNEEFKADLMDSILAETLYKNDPLAQDRLRKLNKKYR